MSVDLRYAVDDSGRPWTTAERERAGRAATKERCCGRIGCGWVEPWRGRGMSQVSGCSHGTVAQWHSASQQSAIPPAAALAPVGELFKSVCCWDHGMPAIACLANRLAPVGGGPAARLCDGQLPARCRGTQDTPTGLFRAHSSSITASSHIGRILLEEAGKRCRADGDWHGRLGWKEECNDRLYLKSPSLIRKVQRLAGFAPIDGTYLAISRDVRYHSHPLLRTRTTFMFGWQ